jgi:hypothetical protein
MFSIGFEPTLKKQVLSLPRIPFRQENIKNNCVYKNDYKGVYKRTAYFESLLRNTGTKAIP